LPSEALARIGTPKLRSQWGLFAPTFSPDGKSFAASTYGSLLVLDATSLQTRVEIKLPPHHDPAGRLVFSPDATLLLGSSYTSPYSGKHYYNTVLWNLAAKKAMRPFNGTEMLAAAFSPDQRFLAASFPEPQPSVRLWDLRENREVRQCQGMVKGIQQLAFMPGGKKLLGISWIGELCCWDVSSGQQSFCKRSEGRLLAPNGAYYLSYKESHVIDAATGEVKLELGKPSPGFQSHFFGADPNTFVHIEPGKVHIWNLTNGKKKDAIPIPKTDQYYSGLVPAALAPDGKVLIAGYHGQTRIYDLTLAADLRERGWLQEPVWHMRFSADDRTLLCSNWPPHFPYYTPRFFSLWDVKTAASARPIMRLDGVSNFQFADGGKRVVFAGAGIYDIQDSRTGAAVYAFKPPTGKERLTWVPDPAPLWISGDGETIIRSVVAPLTEGEKFVRLQTIRVKTSEVVREIKFPGGFPLVAPDGQTVFTYAFEAYDPATLLEQFGRPSFRPISPVTAWNLADGKKRFSLEDKLRKNLPPQEAINVDGGGDPPPKLLAFSPDGKRFAWFQDGPHVHIADMTTGETIHTLPREFGNRPLTFSPDGKMLALDGSRPSLLEIATGKMRHEFMGNDSGAQCVAFSHDGASLAAGFADCTVILWDVWGARTISSKGPRPRLDEAWDSLASESGQTAFAAMRSLYQRADQSVPLISDRLQAFLRHVKAPDIPRLIRDLDSNELRVRQEAEEKLRQLGVTARPALRAAVSELATLEGRRRAERILQDSTAPPSGPWAQALRAIEVLEALPGDGPTKALQTFVRHDARHPLALEAKSSLARRK
jgi:WD40 repeat protein